MATRQLASTTDFEKLLLDDSPDALIATAADGKVLYWSTGAESVFGYARSEAVGRSVQEIIVHDDRVEEERALLDEAIETGVSTYESVRRRKDGSLVYVDISFRLVRDAHGGIEYVLLSKKDVTRLKVSHDGKLVESRFHGLLESTLRRVAERTDELHESREQLRAATEIANDAIVSAGGDGNIVTFNLAASRIFGYTPAEAIGQPVGLLMPERLRDAHSAGMASYLSRGESVGAIGRTTVRTGRRKDGSEFPMEVSLAGWKSRGRNFSTGIIRDITDRSRFEETLQRKNVELENASLAKDRFLANMSHELRTPLNAIIGFTGILLMKLPGPLNADQEKQLKTVQASGRHLLSLINELLDLAKVDAGKVDVRLGPTACLAVLEEVVASLRPQAQAKGLRFDLIAPKEELTVRTDARVLSQIILNLAGNAIKFTPSGSVLIHLSASGNAVEIAVTDTGVGIRAEDQQKLFGAFSRLSSSIWPRDEGTGLGLHLSRKLAELLGGKIRFHSEHGTGSTFTLSLPGP